MSVSWLVQTDIIAGFSLLGVLLVSVPLYWHFAAWNMGCILYIFWIGGQCLVQFVDLMIWRDSAANVAPIWCDIAIRFYIASSLGAICATVVIIRRLYIVASVTSVAISRTEKRRNVLTDLAIGLGVPVLSICLFWFYQSNRFEIVEGVGCVEEYPNTVVAFVLYMAWPIPIGLVTMVYCVLTLRAFFRQRREFDELIRSHTDVNRGLTSSRYFRLMALAALNAIFSVPVGVYTIVLNIRGGPLYEWRGLGDLHSDFGRVDVWTLAEWREDPGTITVINYRLWSPIAGALVFFAFFGMAEEARSHYRCALSSIASLLGIRIRKEGIPGYVLRFCLTIFKV
ncbi:GPCR fungal pheromone mating factor [Daedaleopsis nitida]|nr:GPCR fungal pheromone mating factor [Daedaleopsis nitida]